MSTMPWIRLTAGMAQANELPRPVLRLAAMPQAAACDVNQPTEGDATAFVVAVHGVAFAERKGQARLSAVAQLDMRLLSRECITVCTGDPCRG